MNIWSKREETKFKRGKGQKAIREAKLSEKEWAQKHDQLFGIKGPNRPKR